MKVLKDLPDNIECSYIDDPLNWNEQSDGIGMQWGQKYRGFFLPDEVQKIKKENPKITKIDIMNKLCGHMLGLPCHLWRLPEGMCYRLRRTT
jgi:hypothetical protein